MSGLPGIEIDPSATEPPFEQLRTQVAAQVAEGRLPAGTKLATVRQLAADLGLAAGTVARAYRELEADGVITTLGRRGTFVSSDVPSGRTTRGPRLAQEYATAARRLGLSRAEATLLVEQAWGG